MFNNACLLNTSHNTADIASLHGEWYAVAEMSNRIPIFWLCMFCANDVGWSNVAYGKELHTRVGKLFFLRRHTYPNVSTSVNQAKNNLKNSWPLLLALALEKGEDAEELKTLLHQTLAWFDDLPLPYLTIDADQIVHSDGFAEMQIDMGLAFGDGADAIAAKRRLSGVDKCYQGIKEIFDTGRFENNWMLKQSANIEYVTQNLLALEQCNDKPFIQFGPIWREATADELPLEKQDGLDDVLQTTSDNKCQEIQWLRELNLAQALKLLNPRDLMQLSMQMPAWAKNDALKALFEVEDSLLIGGKVVWAAVIQANTLLFKHTKHLGAPAELLYDPQGLIEPGLLLETAQQCLQFRFSEEPLSPAIEKMAQYLNAETQRAFGVVCPLSDELRISTSYVERRLLPGGFLAMNYFPIVINERHPGLIRPLPEPFWPSLFLSEWQTQARAMQEIWQVSDVLNRVNKRASKPWWKFL